jgi:hypothetical protein
MSCEGFFCAFKSPICNNGLGDRQNAMDVQQCPICLSAVPPYERYPRHVCGSCAGKAMSADGRPLQFGNVDIGGGFDAVYADTREPYQSHRCLIDGIECFADEARFGGIVIEAMPFGDIASALQQCEPNSDDLAFLSLTSKVELPVRDRLAYLLSQIASRSGGRIAREYKRSDVAWLIGKSPLAIIELKACYTFDLIAQPAVYMQYLMDDLKKAADCGGYACRCYAILLATHPKAEIPETLYDTVKYSRKINAALKLCESAEGIRRRAIEEVEMRLSPGSAVHRFQWSLGSYLGIEVDLFGWLIQADLSAPSIGTSTFASITRAPSVEANPSRHSS